MLKPDLEAVKKTLQKYDFPVDVIVETIAYCNLDCIMCPQPNLQRKRGEMSFEVFKKIADEIALESAETRLWVAIMGEPLIRAGQLVEMISYAKNKGVNSVHLNTNGILMSKEIAKKLIQSGLDEIILGLDAASAETYENIRVNGNYQLLIQNIDNLLN